MAPPTIRRLVRVLSSLLCVFVVLSACPPAPPPAEPPVTLSGLEAHEYQRELGSDGEAIVSLTGEAAGVSWATAGAESLVIEVLVDGAARRHVVWSTGSERIENAVSVGMLNAGSHTVRVRALAAPAGAPEASVTLHEVSLSLHPDQALAKHSPIIAGRLDTTSTDLPVLMYATKQSNRVTYNIIYTNEDSQPLEKARTLMSKFGRITDIEWVTEATLDADGNAVKTMAQGFSHLAFEFTARFEGTHPMVQVISANGIFFDQVNPQALLLAPVPSWYDADAQATRESFADAHPWVSRLEQEEGVREDTIDPTCTRADRAWALDCYLFVELHAKSATNLGGRRIWGTQLTTQSGKTFRSDLGLSDDEYRIDRVNWQRTAIPLPRGETVASVDVVVVPDGKSFDLSFDAARIFRLDSYEVAPIFEGPVSARLVPGTEQAPVYRTP